MTIYNEIKLLIIKKMLGILEADTTSNSDANLKFTIATLKDLLKTPDNIPYISNRGLFENLNDSEDKPFLILLNDLYQDINEEDNSEATALTPLQQAFVKGDKTSIMKAIDALNKKEIKEAKATMATASHKHSTHKQSKDFTNKGKVEKANEYSFVHEVEHTQKKPKSGNPKRNEKKWYFKPTLKNEDEITRSEVVAQEFFRFCIHGQPKTRLVYAANKCLGLVSEGVPGFMSFAPPKEIQGDKKEEALFYANIKSKLNANEYYGLGRILVIALWINEGDLRLENLGVNENGQVIKIDGDWCFSALRKRKFCGNHSIRVEDLKMLFFPPNHHQWNWLDTIIGGTKYTTSRIVDRSLAQTESFIHEVNFTLLQAAVFPPAVFATFISRYNSETSEQYLLDKETTARQKQLVDAALQFEPFLDYLSSNTAEEDLNNLMEKRWGNFKTMSKDTLLTDADTQEIWKNFHKLDPQKLRMQFAEKMEKETAFSLSESEAAIKGLDAATKIVYAAAPVAEAKAEAPAPKP